jgi:hypothetical protein
MDSVAEMQDWGAEPALFPRSLFTESTRLLGQPKEMKPTVGGVGGEDFVTVRLKRDAGFAGGFAEYDLRMVRLAMALVLSAFSLNAAAQASTLPNGSQTRWVVDQPQEIVAYVVFDTAAVKRELPQSLRFVTLGELAKGKVGWAADYLAKHPTQGDWGVSFFEIVRMEIFSIDGRAPHWPKDGAAALWFARVAPSDPAADLGPGQPFLALNFWLPDRAYAAYMREKGYSATYGEAKLLQDSDGTWRGTANADGLSVTAACVPVGPVSGGVESAGAQAFFPPLSSSVKNVVRVSFSGHRERDCGNSSLLDLRGKHPLAGGVVMEPMVFEYRYSLKGGTYPQ